MQYSLDFTFVFCNDSLLSEKQSTIPCFLCAQIRHTEWVWSMELLFNFRNVHSLFGMRRMLVDSLRWILFYTPLNSKQHLYSSLLDAILWLYVCVCSLEGWGIECDLVRPGVPVRITLSSPDQSNTETLAPPGNHEIYSKMPWQPEEQWWNHNSVQQPSWDVC